MFLRIATPSKPIGPFRHDKPHVVGHMLVLVFAHLLVFIRLCNSGCEFGSHERVDVVVGITSDGSMHFMKIVACVVPLVSGVVVLMVIVNKVAGGSLRVVVAGDIDCVGGVAAEVCLLCCFVGCCC